MKYDYYERDEVIRPAKKKIKPKVAKSKHRHEYKEIFVAKDGHGISVDRTEEQCSICGKIGKVFYHWEGFKRH